MVDVGVEHSNSLNFNSKWPEKNFARDSPLPLKLIFLGRYWDDVSMCWTMEEEDLRRTAREKRKIN